MSKHIPFPNSFQPMLTSDTRDFRTDAKPYSYVRQGTASLIHGLYQASKSIALFATHSFQKLRRGSNTDYANKKKALTTDTPPSHYNVSFKRQIQTSQPLHIINKRIKLKDDSLTQTVDGLNEHGLNQKQETADQAYKSREIETLSFNTLSDINRNDYNSAEESEESRFPIRTNLIRSLEKVANDNMPMAPMCSKIKQPTRNTASLHQAISKAEVRDLIDDITIKLLKEIKESREDVQHELDNSLQEILKQSSVPKEKLPKLKLIIQPINTKLSNDINTFQNYSPLRSNTDKRPQIFASQFKIEEEKAEKKEEDSANKPQETQEKNGLLGINSIAKNNEENHTSQSALQSTEKMQENYTIHTSLSKPNDSPIKAQANALIEAKTSHNFMNPSLADIKSDSLATEQNKGINSIFNGASMNAGNFINSFAPENVSSLFPKLSKMDEKKQEAPKQASFQEYQKNASFFCSNSMFNANTADKSRQALSETKEELGVGMNSSTNKMMTDSNVPPSNNGQASLFDNKQSTSTFPNLAFSQNQQTSSFFNTKPNENGLFGNNSFVGTANNGFFANAAPIFGASSNQNNGIFTAGKKKM